MKFLITLFLFSFASLAFSQENKLPGEYWADSEHYVKIHPNDTLEFFSLYGCCLLTGIYGMGTYEIRDSMVSVTTIAPNAFMNSGHQIIGPLSNDDRVQITVMNSNGPVPYCGVAIRNISTTEIIKGSSTDENGFVAFDHLNTRSDRNFTIEFAKMGMDSYSIKLEEVIGKSIIVDLKPYRVVQHEIVEFKISKGSDSIQLIGPILKGSEDGSMSGRDKLKMVFTNWPWHWNFSHNHRPVPRKFEKK